MKRGASAEEQALSPDAVLSAGVLMAARDAEIEDALKALDALPVREWEVVSLRLMRGIPRDTVASALGLSVQQVRTIERHAIEKLREEVL